MKIKKSSKFFRICKYTFLSMLLLALLLFVFKKDIFILITHLSYKSELSFTKKFLKDFKDNNSEKLRGYFLNEKLIVRQLKFMKMYDKQLHTRIYYIDEFLLCYRFDEITRKSIKIKDEFCVKISTRENGKRLDWIEIYIIKKNGKYYIDHFQISEHFPRPPNEH